MIDRGTLGWMKQSALDRILDGGSDANIGFQELRQLLLSFDFEERVRGSHHIFSRVGVDELINLQREGNKAKPYQVKQVRRILVKYRLASEG